MSRYRVVRQKRKIETGSSGFTYSEMVVDDIVKKATENASVRAHLPKKCPVGIFRQALCWCAHAIGSGLCVHTPTAQPLESSVGSMS